MGQSGRRDLPVAYVRRSLANTFVNQKRKASSREVVLELVPDRWDGSDDMNLLVERDAMWALLATLPERQRTALVLRYYHDLPDEEIAAALSCRAGTVRSLMSRGLATLREQPAAAALPARQRRLR
jgi:RNA polymerase sigma factor (sigma-70 family)